MAPRLILSLVAAMESACRPPALAASTLASSGAAELRQNERRKIVEIRGAEAHRPVGEAIRVERQTASETRGGEAQREIVRNPSSVGAPGDMG